MSLLPKMNEMEINLKVDERRGVIYGVETSGGHFWGTFFIGLLHLCISCMQKTNWLTVSGYF